MQSLYKVIKSNSVVKQGEEKIKTNYKRIVSLEKGIEEENSKNFIDSYEKMLEENLKSSYQKLMLRLKSLKRKPLKKVTKKALIKDWKKEKNPVMKKLMKLI